MPYKKSSQGFSIIELMITIVIAAIVLAVAVPSMMGIITKSSMVSVTNDLVGDLNLARSESARTGSRVVVCPSSNGTSCVGAWQDGRIIFRDLNSDGVLDATDPIVRVRESVDAGKAVLTGGPQIVFRSSGVATAAATMAVCHTGYLQRTISVSVVGHITSTPGPNCI